MPHYIAQVHTEDDTDIHDWLADNDVAPLFEKISEPIAVHALIEAARRVLDIYRRPKMYDAEDFDDAIATLDAALPPEPHAPIRPKREDDPF